MSESIITFIGAGNIARAIIGGLVDAGYPRPAIRAVDPSAEQRAALPESIAAFDEAGSVLDEAAAIIVCVKPDLVRPVLAELGPSLSGQLVISVAAGVTVATMSNAIGYAGPVVRCMPNTPALVQAGMIGLYANDKTSQGQRNLAETVMQAVGETLWFKDESDLDAVTAVSGSGPAYFFLVMEAMEQAAIELGLARETARKLVLQTALGAARMAIQSDDDPAQLRRNVTSPGGTTEAAINALIDSDLHAAFAGALRTARQRSEELAKEADVE